ncbi:thioesterase [Aliidongia dinghuensis]|uniref:Thioesterase n=1 Tax=Aliidongia dinghuensis TaxID=1867774 RepID=A0A8J3E2J0_9PROT|nr:PaaI family thioesterase [Aliidongia dinghuensis]GGE99082.1 thioesterase [Aliidongia dinghuensis]
MTEKLAVITPHPSAFNEAVGLRLVDWIEGRATVELDVTGDHLNRSGYVHGGVLMTLIDVACGYAGTWSPTAEGARLCVTLDLTTSFVAPACGGRLTTVATVTGGGRKIYFARAEVRDEAGQLLAMGQGSFRYR